MKRIVYYIIIATSAIIAFACQKEKDVKSDAVTFTINGDAYQAVFAENETKAYIGTDLKAYWNKGDAISVFSSTTYNWKYLFQGKDGDKEGIFVPEPISEEYFIAVNDIDADAVFAVYPYKGLADEYGFIYGNGINTDGTLEVVVPFEQSFVPGVLVSPESAPMVAATKDAKSKFLAFKNVCGFITVPLYGQGEVSRVRIESNGGEWLSGKASIKASSKTNPEIIEMSYGACNTDIVFDTPITLSANSKSYFTAAVIPATLSYGLSVTVFLTDGSERYFSTMEEHTVERNTVYTMSPLEIKELEAVTFVDPVSGSSEIVFHQTWWGEEHLATIKYKEFGRTRYCVAECLDAGGMWGDSIGTTIEFIWHLDQYDDFGNQIIDVPSQYMGFSYPNQESLPLDQVENGIFFGDYYNYYLQMGQFSGSADSYYGIYGQIYPRSYYDERGKFVFNVSYFVPGLGRFSSENESMYATVKSYTE